VEVFYQRDRIGYVLPMEPGMDCLVLEMQPDDFPRFRADPEGELDAAFRTLPGMARRMEGATLEGPVRGTRGVENYLRVPAGPGWVLTGDAGMTKDPSTGTGIEDAFRQSFLLAEALGATLDGADWESTMSEYHRQRDAAVVPSYRSTLNYTRTGVVPDEALALVQGLASNAGFVRLLGLSFPAMLHAPNALPAGVVAAIERSASRFEAAQEPEVQTAA
jgi:flavin-dependent dehydrogenase